MRYIKFYFLLIMVLSIYLVSCSNTRNDITAPQAVSVHGPDVMNINAATFHGHMITTQGLAFCETCHGSDFSGGTAKVSCATPDCHQGITVHKTGIVDQASANFHGAYLKNNSFNLSQCTPCHSTNYSGGMSSPTCRSASCHAFPGGPEACNTCHGDLTNPAHMAPPRGVNGETDVNNAKVGLHSYHLFNTTVSSLVACNECHTVPTALTSPGHININGKAQVNFLTSKTGIGAIQGSYDFNNNQCSNTYCHGNFRLSYATSQYQFIYDNSTYITGANKTVPWINVQGNEAACGTCHGLPPTGHVSYNLNECYVCHQGVMDKTGKIIDKTKHINGKVDVFGLEY